MSERKTSAGRSCPGMAAGGGLTVGGLLAIILSWTVNHSVLWAIVHLFCSWIYVIYWCIVHI